MSQSRQARKPPRGGVALEDAFAYGCVERSVSFPQLDGDGLLVLHLDRLLGLFDQGLDPGFRLSIPCPSLQTLAVPFDR